MPLKRGASRRVLRLSSPLLNILHGRRAQLDRLQLRAGQRWHDNNLVFPSQVGTPRKGANLWRSWKRLLRRLGLPDYKFHELRHTAASLAMPRAPACSTSRACWAHTSISITADTYGHMTDEGREDAAARMGRALFGPAGGL